MSHSTAPAPKRAALNTVGLPIYDTATTTPRRAAR